MRVDDAGRAHLELIGKDLVIEEVMMTPEMASRLIRFGGLNRVYTRRADRYAREMLSGVWTDDTCSAVLVGAKGDLKDGFGRLAAIVQTGLPRPMLVIYGISDPAVDNIDRGKSRTLSDVIHMRGMRYSKIRSSVPNWVNDFFLIGPRSIARMSALPMSDALLLGEDEELYPFLASVVSDNLKTFAPDAFWVAAKWLLHQVYGTKHDGFFLEMSDGSGPAGSPTRVLRETYLRWHARRDKSTVLERTSVAVIALADYIAGRSRPRRKVMCRGIYATHTDMLDTYATMLGIPADVNPWFKAV